MDRESQVSMEHDYDGMMADSDCESSSDSGFRQFKEFSEIGMVKVEEDQGEHGVIKKTLLGGMGFIGNEINLVAIHKNSHSSVTGQAKLEAFQIYCQAVAARRGGDANLRYGWYGGSRDEICDILNFGFENSSSSQGNGVYLSPANLLIESALRAEEDENGVRHMLMCRVILGKTETISPGSKQLQPSSIDFDSGIDNPLEPTKYIIWTAYMNTHIFPAYIISFTAPSLAGWGTNWSSAKKPSSPSMKFQVLMKVLSRFLPPSKMCLISNYYNDFRANKIGRPLLIRRLRSLVGDNVLISVIKMCKDQVHYSNFLHSSMLRFSFEVP
ncbi:hypothetical protein ACS0TY_010256 [Phlomoides rotata]